MEGTHTVLQLHTPIMELCYISFYLPEGKVRGFTYKGCLTLDRTRKRFCSCYQVQEQLEMELKEQPYESFGEIIFHQTTTKDILMELYKLTADKERPWRSRHVPGLNTGQQEGKRQNVAGVPKLKGEDYSSFISQQKIFLDSTNKDSLNQARMRKYRRKESFQEFRHRRGGKKIHEQHLSVMSTPDMQLQNKKRIPTRFPNRSFPSSFSTSRWVTIKCKDDFPVDSSIQPEEWTGEGYFLDSKRAVKVDADITSSSSKHSKDLAAAELVDDRECTPGVTKVQQSTLVKPPQDCLSNKLETLSESAAAKSLTSSMHTELTCKGKPGVTAVGEVQDSGACIKVAKPLAESLPDFHRDEETISAVLTTVPHEFLSKTGVCSREEAAGDLKSIRLQEKEQDSSGLQQKAERVPITDESCNLLGAVNKALLKVIRSDSLDEAAEWKRLHQISRVERNLPGSVPERRTPVSRGGSKHLVLNLPVNESPDLSQASNHLKLEEKRLPSPLLAAVSNVFSSSSPLPSTHRQMSPIPSPLASRLPSPQLHHRILPLPAQLTGDEPAFSDYGSGRHGAINFSFTDLEPQFYLKLSDPAELGFASRQPDLLQNATEGRIEKRALHDELPAQAQHSFCPAESALKDDFTEQLTNLDMANKDEDTWVLDCRLGHSNPFAHTNEREKINRNVLHLSLELNSWFLR
ncbi:formin-1-like isoform X2 [Pogoniulus pusillus]|uniref:formin-1-like isoform X2 n=1 Tax=Pogoniulus pusillus TaxID=488313 RepID=UPI0030B92CF3